MKILDLYCIVDIFYIVYLIFKKLFKHSPFNSPRYLKKGLNTIGSWDCVDKCQEKTSCSKYL